MTVTRYLLFLLLLVTLPEARENPFFPAEGMKEMPVTSSEVQSFDPLRRAAITLPDSARVIKEVKVTFQNLDGSMESKSISLDHSIDWHLPLFVSQSYSATKPDEPQETPPAETAEAPMADYKKLVDFGEAAFWQSGTNLKIVTEDRLLRHFMMVKPHRIVLDFKRNADFRSKSHTIKAGNPYKAIRLGNHSGYYRAVIELDGQYRYALDLDNEGIVIRCY
jgi:hypothetical protein